MIKKPTVYPHQIIIPIENKFEYKYDEQNSTLESNNPLLILAAIHYLKQQKQLSKNIQKTIKIEPFKWRSLLIFINKVRFKQIKLSTIEQFDFFYQYMDKSLDNIKMILQVYNQKKLLKSILVYFDFGDTILHKIMSFYFHSKQILSKQEFIKYQIIKQIIPKPQEVHINIEDNNLYIFGNQVNLKLYLKKFMEMKKELKMKQFAKGDSTINNYLWAYRREFSQNNKQTKMIIHQDHIDLYYMQRSIDFFHDIPQIDEIPLDVFKPFLQKDKEMKQYIYRNPDFLQIKGEKLVGVKQSINKIKKLINLQKQYIPQNHLPNKFKIIQVSELNIDQNNYIQFLKKAQSFKCIEKQQYQLSLKDFGKITNRIKYAKKIFIIYDNFYQLIELQSIIDTPWPLSKLGGLIDQLRKNFTQVKHKFNLQKDVQVYLLRRNKNQNWRDFIKMIKETKETYATILFKKKYFKQYYDILTNIKSCITVGLEGFIGMTPDIPIKISERIEKCSALKKDNSHIQILQLVKQILRKNIKSYKLHNYILDPITCFNIQKFKIEGLNKIQIIISNESQAEYVYLVFFQKLFLIEKDQNGNFLNLKQAKITDSLNKLEERILNNKIKESFIYGYHFFFICNLIQTTQVIINDKKYNSDMFEKNQIQKTNNDSSIDLSTKDQIESVNNFNLLQKIIFSDHLTLLYWKYFLKDNKKYKIQTSIHTEDSYFQSLFSNTYNIHITDPILVKEIEIMKIGSNNFKKKHKENGVSFNADRYITLRVIQQLLKKYSH